MLDIDPSFEIKLSGTDIYFDSNRAVALSFISSAAVKTLPRHEKIIATPETVKLLGKKVNSSAVLSSPYGKPFNLGNYSVELIPSGRMLGASQVVIEKNKKRIIYAGSFKLRHAATAAFAEIRRCDTLIVNCAYGLTKAPFPDQETVMQSIFEFVNQTFSEEKTPVILINPLGKAQDLIIFLGERNVELSLHPIMAKTLRLYSELDVKIPAYGGISRKNLKNKVLIAPFSYRTSETLKNLKEKKVAAVTGQAMESGAMVRSFFQADVAFPLSNHGGYGEILEYLNVSRPKSVILRGSFSEELVERLGKDGWNVTALKKPRQINLF